MPKLPTYTADLAPAAPAGGRRATAEDFGAVDISAGVASVQKAAHGVLVAKEEDESRQVLVAQAEIRAKYAQRLDQAILNGEDVGKIKDDLNNDLANVTQNLQTKKGLETAALHAANTGMIFDQQANHIEVARASANARVEGSKFVNALGLQVSRDPSSLQRAEQDVDAFAATLTKVPGEHRTLLAGEWKQTLNAAAAMSSIRANPEEAKKKLENGEWNLSVAQREHALNRVTEEINGRRRDAAYEREQQHYAIVEQVAGAEKEHFDRIMAGTATWAAIRDDPRLQSNTPEAARTREHLQMMLEARSKALAGQEKKSDPRVVRDLWLAVNAPDGAPNKIYTRDKIFEAVKDGHVNTTDANQLNAMVDSQKDENHRSFSTRLNGRIQTVASAMRSSPEFQAQPELAAAIQIELMTQAERKAAELRKAGKAPDSLLDPDSKDYYFKPNLIKSVADDVKRQQNALLPRVTTQAEYDALPAGATYVDSNGHRASKKAK